MDGSRVAQSLDSLWFYTNILTIKPLPSLTHQSSHLQKQPDVSFPVNHQQNMENSTPAECAEARAMVPGHSESVKKEKKERKKRRKRNKLRVHETNLMCGEFDMVKEESYNRYEMPPFDDVVAMKRHLRSWAYAVGVHCQIKHFARR